MILSAQIESRKFKSRHLESMQVRLPILDEFTRLRDEESYAKAVSEDRHILVIHVGPHLRAFQADISYYVPILREAFSDVDSVMLVIVNGRKVYVEFWFEDSLMKLGTSEDWIMVGRRDLVEYLEAL